MDTVHLPVAARCKPADTLPQRIHSVEKPEATGRVCRRKESQLLKPSILSVANQVLGSSDHHPGASVILWYTFTEEEDEAWRVRNLLRVTVLTQYVAGMEQESWPTRLGFKGEVLSTPQGTVLSNLHISWVVTPSSPGRQGPMYNSLCQ